LIATVATMTLYNVAKAQLTHVPSMTKMITSGLGNMSKTISKTMNITGSKTMNSTAGGNMSKK
jgi:hypothetical protein